MIIAFLIFITVVGIISLVFVGAAMLIAALVTKFRAAEKRKRQPSYYVRRGLIYLAVPLTIAVGFGIYYGYKAAKRASYETVLDMWRDGEGGFGREGEELVKDLLKAADKGDRELFVKHFSDRMRKEEGFDQLIDEFLRNYPGGLSGADVEMLKAEGLGSSGRPLDNGGYVSTENVKYVLRGDGKWYYIIVSFVDMARNADDYIGVCYIRLLDAGARAEFNLTGKYRNDADIACETAPFDASNVRVIYNDAYVWKETGGRLLTRDEAKALFKECGEDSAKMAERLGTPNAEHDEYSDFHYKYYELMPEEGQRRYLMISFNDIGWRGSTGVYSESEYLENLVVKYGKNDKTTAGRQDS